MERIANDVIRAILKRGNDVQIQRKGDGYVILEVQRTVRGIKRGEQAFEKVLQKDA